MRSRRGRRLALLFSAALGVLATSGLTASAAQADDVHFEFDHVVAQIGSFTDSQLVDPGVPDDPMTMDGEIDPATGDFTVQPDDFFFPEKTFQDVPAPGINVTISPLIDTPVTGNLDTTTGDADADVDLDVDIDISGGATDHCEIENIPLALETTGTLSTGGNDYDAAVFAPPTGDGAFVELWDDIPDSTGGPLCGVVNGETGGPGGIFTDGFAEVTTGEPFHVEFNAGTLQLGTQDPLGFLSDEEPATLDGTIDTATGDFTVPAGQVDIPPASTTTPVPAEISSDAADDVTGNFDEATGQLDIDMVIDSTTVVFPGAPNEVTCHFDDFEWDLSTENTTPFEGRRFTEGLDGDGAVDASWADIPPVRDGDPAFCGTVRGLAMGPGGVILEHLAGTGALDASVKPKNTKIKQGRTKTFTLTVENTGDADATGVQACVKAPKKAFKVKGGKCKNLATLAPDASKKAKFKVQAKKKAKPKKYTLKFTAKSPDATNATASAKVKVQKR
jgi:hypothetical protein